MTMALLSLLLGCFNQPVVAVVEMITEPEPWPCGNYKYTLKNPSDVLPLDDKCCTAGGGERIGWKSINGDSDILYPVCLYR
tara:strand:+ start:239 stop:481 length:243 start_codon:yes stop_codon:yes gene_type:complete